MSLIAKSVGHMEMYKHFTTFYESILSPITTDIDKSQLELDPTIFVYEKKFESSAFSAMMKILHPISLKWITINATDNTLSGAGFEDYDCNLVSKCISSQRIILVMDIYKQYFLSKYVYSCSDSDQNESKDDEDNVIPEFVDVFNHVLRGYSVVHLLNDFLHIQYVHILKHKQQNMFKNCEAKSKHGVLNCCDYYLRKNRRFQMRRNYHSWLNKFDIYFNNLDYQTRNLLELCSKIHTTTNHTIIDAEYDHRQEKKETDLFKIRPLNVRSMQYAGGKADAKFNKFINEVTDNNTKTKAQKGNSHTIDGLHDLLTKHSLGKDEYTKFKKILDFDEYDTDSVAYDVEDGFSNSNIYDLLNQNKFHLSLINNYLNTLPQFEFGKYQFKYWSYFHKHPTFIPKPKYTSLKQECLNNGIFPIQLWMFNQTLNKSYIYTNSNKGKTLKACDKQGDNNNYEIPVSLPISVAHIFVLILYCNFNKLQYHYKKHGCREHNDQETLQDLRKRNMEIGNWYKLLKECVLFYGTMATSSDTFYTGLNTRLLFGSFTPSFNCPISTSISWDIANQFADGKGVILELRGIEGSKGDPYFNVQWLSCYPDEKERLFFSASRLEIVDINTYEGYIVVYNTQYLRAFRLWSSLFDGYFVHEWLRRNKHRTTQKILINLIVDYMENNGIINDDNSNTNDILIPLYMQQMFSHLVQKLKTDDEIRINPSTFRLLLPELRSLLMSGVVIDWNRSNWQLSAFLRSTIGSKRRIKWMEEYFWILSDRELKKLKKSKADEIIYREPMTYAMGQCNNSQDVIRFDIGICRRANGTQFAGYCIDITKASSVLNAYWSICVDETNWMANGEKETYLGQGASIFRLCFSDSLINKLTSLTIRFAIEFHI